METHDLLGYAAACMTTVSFAPQAWHTWRSKDVSGISLPMYSIFTAGVALWLAYGIASGDVPVLVANAVTLVLAAAVLAMKLRYGRAERPFCYRNESCSRNVDAACGPI
jgi:MtN3 and saliva related transmembrane protein